ncbi:MAG: hypothetical protein AB1384_06400 [Actinomycetota bacterium]
MQALKIVLLVLALCIVILAVIYAVAFLLIRRLRARAVAALRSDTAGEKVYHVADCNYFGLLSEGLAQVRGNGLLALTSGGIRFRMLAPQRTLFIPRGSVRAVSHPRWFLKKTKARDLLRVDFINDRGDEDAAAWIVRDPRWWDGAIAALQADRGPAASP